MDKVNMAIVGCGTISQLNAPGYIQHPNCEITALCDPIRERAEQRAHQWGISPRIHTDYHDLLNDTSVDAVELLTPTHMHPQQIVDGLNAGKHISCQKPISSTVAETDTIAVALTNATTKFRITENFIYYPPIVKAKQLLDSGAIGEPCMVRIRTVRGKLAQSQIEVSPGAYVWRRDPMLHAGGMLYDDGWHKYATAIWWVGEIEKVQSFISKSDDFLDETPSVAIWKFKDRDCMGMLDYSSAPEMNIRGRYYAADEFFEIQGSKGAIWVTRCTGEMLDLPPVMLVKGTETTGIQVAMDWIEGFNGAAADFIDCIVQDRQPNMDLSFSRHTMQTAMAVYKAATDECPIRPSSLT